MQSLKKNVIYQNLYHLFISLTPLITAPYVSRVLGAENIGINSYVSSITAYFAFLSLLGISNHGSRVIAQTRDERMKLNIAFSELFFLRMMISLFILFIYLIFVITFITEFQLLFFIQALTVLSALINITWFFTGIEQFRIAVSCKAIVKIVSVICIFSFVKNDSHLWIYILILALSEFLVHIILWFYVKRFVSLVRPTFKGIKTHIKPLFILFVPVLAVSIYTVLNKIMLRTITDETQLGFFVNSEKVFAVASGFISAFSIALMPRMSNLSAKKGNFEKNRLMILSMKYAMILAFAMTFGMLSIASVFTPLFFGKDFIDCIPLIISFSLAIPFIAFRNVISAQYHIPQSKDKTFTLTSIIGALISLPANMILIPQFQAMGAVWSRLIVEVIMCIIISISVLKILPLWVYIKDIIPFLITGFMMFFLVKSVGIFIGQSIFSLIIQVLTGGIFYLGVSVGWLVFTKDEFFMRNWYVFRKWFRGHIK
ncbi:MAG: oligosaccharide flippase family protein [Lachnospiraceae bacterium]|nr:oligosaccharide flippase family protein [Lachnospiraceae bacterium]